MSANPFDYLNAINITKENMVADEYGERGYNPWMVNRGLSFFRDSVMQANEMNRLYHLDKAIQFTFLLNTVTPRKRFSKWHKAEKVENLDVVKEYFGYNHTRALEAMSLLTDAQIEEMRKSLNKGGRG